MNPASSPALAEPPANVSRATVAPAPVSPVAAPVAPELAPPIAADGTLRLLDDVVAERRVKPRDCRVCKNFRRDDSGLNFGWCGAHQQPVKLYHPSGEWFSQCTFKALRRFKDSERERGGVPSVTADGRLIRERAESAT